MDGSEKLGTVPSPAHVMGAEQAGITPQTASRVGDKIIEAYERRGRRVRVKGLRFIPSTKVELGQGMFQVMASTIVEGVSSVKGHGRAEAIDSVITVSGSEGQVLETVKIPYLDQTRTRI